MKTLALVLALYATNFDRTLPPRLPDLEIKIPPQVKVKDDVAYMLSTGMLIKVSPVFDGATQIEGRQIDEGAYRWLSQMEHVSKDTIRALHESGRPCLYGIFYGSGFGETPADFLYLPQIGSLTLGKDTAKVFPLKNDVCK